jgi:hypothetical protein
VVVHGGRERTDLLGGGEVLGHLAGQRKDVAGDGAEDPVDRVHRAVVGLGHLRGVLPGHRLTDQPGARFEADAQRVLGDQRRGVGVIGRDRRLAGPQCRGDLLEEER